MSVPTVVGIRLGSLYDSWTNEMEHDFQDEQGHPVAWASGCSRASRWPGEETVSVELPGAPTSNVAISSDGKLVAIACGRYIDVYAIDAGEHGQVTLNLERTLSVHVGTAAKVHFHPEGRLLAASGDNIRGTGGSDIRLWDLGRDAEPVDGGREAEATVTQLAERAAQAALAQAPSLTAEDVQAEAEPLAGAFAQSLREAAQRSDIRHGRAIGNAHFAGLGAHPFSADGTMMFYVTSEHPGRIAEVVVVYDVHARAVRARLEGHQGYLLWVGSSPDSRLVATSSWDGTVRIWDAGTGAALRTFKSAGEKSWAAEFSPDGRLIAAGSDEQTVEVWNVETGELLHTFGGFRGSIRGLAITQDAQGWTSQGSSHMYLAASATGATVRVLDMGTGTCVQHWQAKCEYPSSQLHIKGLRYVANASGTGSVLCFKNPVGNIIVYDAVKNVKWELEEDRGEGSEERHRAIRTESFSITPDGKILLSAHGDNVMRAWHLV